MLFNYLCFNFQNFKPIWITFNFRSQIIMIYQIIIDFFIIILIILNFAWNLFMVIKILFFLYFVQ